VTGDEGVAHDGKVVLEDVQVGPADSAGKDAEEGVAGSDGGTRDIFDGERLCGGAEDSGFHRYSF
jgi:hypothetical protein